MLADFAKWVQGIVASLGYPGLFILIVLESTMVPIPSLLVMPFAGFLATEAGGKTLGLDGPLFSLPVILVINSAGALTGSLLSYWFGAKGGKPLLLRYGKWVMLRPKDIQKAEAYFARRGNATVLIARFLPVVRHLISIPAGIAKMPLRKFILQTFIGSTLWGGGLMVVGYALGSQWEAVAQKAKRIDLVIAGVIVVAILAIAVRFVIVRRRERKQKAAAPDAD